ncbi:hypothetical protein D3C78_1551830 [compost metagenome]
MKKTSQGTKVPRITAKMRLNSRTNKGRTHRFFRITAARNNQLMMYEYSSSGIHEK